MPEVKLSEQQLELVTILWRLEAGTARDVLNAMDDPNLAYTTIATVLSRLEKRGVLASETQGRERVYRPLITERDVKTSMVSSLISSLFKGDPKALMAHLVREGDVDEDELEDLGKLLEGEKRDV